MNYWEDDPNRKKPPLTPGRLAIAILFVVIFLIVIFTA